MKRNRTKEKRPGKFCKLFREWSNRLKKWLKCMTLEHPFRMMIMVSGGLLLIALLFRWGLYIVRETLHMTRSHTNEGFMHFVRTDQGIDTWFSFFGSYFGVIATVVLGIITLRFSFRLGQREQLAKVREIKIEQMLLYDMFSDFAPSQWKHSDTRQYRFLLEIVLAEYDSVYSSEIDEVWWGNCNKDYGCSDKRKLSDYKAYVDNAGKTTIYIYFNELEAGASLSGDALRDTVLYFYHIREYEPFMMERHELCRWIEIYMKLTDITWFKNQEPDAFWIKFSIVVENSKKLEKCVELHEIIHGVEISNTRYNINEK